jgi:ferredoxin
MSVYSMYFSPTGGTKKVMDILTEGLSVDSQIDLSPADADYSAYSFTEEDICLIGTPSFGGRVPSIVLERMRRMRASGAMAILVVVFGNRAYDDTLLELKNESSACGYKVGAAVAAVAEHSIMRQYGKARPDAQDEMELRQFGKEIAGLITDRNAKDFTVPGNSQYRKYGGVPFKPKANKDCTKCGQCAEKCPVQAIAHDDPASLNKEKCISCMRCIVVCPQNARKLNKAALFAASLVMKKAFIDRKQNELYL